MAISYDTETRYPASGRTSASGDLATSHSGSANAKGVVVLVNTEGASVPLTGVMYGATQLTYVGAATDPIEQGRVDVWVSGAIASGTQTVTFQGTSGNGIFATIATVNAAGGVGVAVSGGDADSSGTATVAGRTLTTSVDACTFCVVHHGNSSNGTALAGCTLLHSHAYSNGKSGQTVRRTAVDAPGTYTTGVTIAPDDFAAFAVALQETSPEARSYQQALEVLAQGASDARSYQQAVEALVQGTSDARSYQEAIEVLVEVVGPPVRPTAAQIFPRGQYKIRPIAGQMFPRGDVTTSL